MFYWIVKGVGISSFICEFVSIRSLLDFFHFSTKIVIQRMYLRNREIFKIFVPCILQTKEAAN